MKSLRNTLVGLVAALSLLVLPVAIMAFAPDASAAPNIQDCLSQGTSLETGSGGTCQAANTGDATTKINDIITTIINVFSLVVGIVAVIMIIVGGFKYITSGGDSGSITSAKNTIIYAVIGLVVVALAQFFVQFVLGKVTG